MTTATSTCAACGGAILSGFAIDRYDDDMKCVCCGRSPEPPRRPAPPPERPVCAGGYCAETKASNGTPYGRCPSCLRVIRCTVDGMTVLHREPTEYSEEQRMKGAFEERFGLPAEVPNGTKYEGQQRETVHPHTAQHRDFGTLKLELERVAKLYVNSPLGDKARRALRDIEAEESR